MNSPVTMMPITEVNCIMLINCQWRFRNEDGERIAQISIAALNRQKDEVESLDRNCKEPVVLEARIK